MSTGTIWERGEPLRRTAWIMAVMFVAALTAAISLAMPGKAHADGAESGIAYVEYRIHATDGSIAAETGQKRAFATYTQDKSAYTVRINATHNAVDASGAWHVVTSSGSDITSECTYDERAGLVVIPRVYIDEPVVVTVNIDAVQAHNAFDLTLAIISGTKQGQSSVQTITASASAAEITLPVANPVKAVTQDSQLLDTSEWAWEGGTLTINGRSALGGSVTVYLDSYEAAIEPYNAIQAYDDNAIRHSISAINKSDSKAARSTFASPRSKDFGVTAWIVSTNQGGGDWDYTDYTVWWGDNSATLYCCEHGVYHMLESEGGGGNVWMTGTYTGTGLVNQYDVWTDTTIEHHYVYRDYYDLYVNAGYYQDVSGSWSTDYESVTYTPRTGYLDFVKASSAPDISTTSHYKYDAVYGVYTDPGCGSFVGNVWANASGYGKSGPLNVGWYYVKETIAPQGFELNPTIYPVYVSADATTRVNGSTVVDAPKTATVRFFVDGGTAPVATDMGKALAYNYLPEERGVQRATGAARKPNCTPGLDAWYTDKALTQKWTGSTLMGDLDLYARNVATVTYAPTAGSALSDDLPLRKKMEESSPLLNVATDILPPARQANWGGKITLKDPLLKIVYYHDGERWRTLRWVEGGWFKTKAGVGDQISTLPIQQDTTIYGEFSRSTYDGIYSW